LCEVCALFFYSPTDAQVTCLKNIFKIYIKLDIKAAPTCFGAVTPSSGSTLLVLAKVTVVCGDVATTTSLHTIVFCVIILTTVTLASTSNTHPDDGVTAPKHVGAVLILILM
jgi:hypothetical protein